MLFFEASFLFINDVSKNENIKSCFLLNQECPKEIGAYSHSYYSNYPDEIAILFQKFYKEAISISNESWLNPIGGKIRKIAVIGTRGSSLVDLLVPDTIKIIGTYIESNNNKGERRIIQEGTQIRRLDATQPLRSYRND